MIHISQDVKGLSELGLCTNSLAIGTVHLYLPGQVDTAVAPMYGERQKQGAMRMTQLTHQISPRGLKLKWCD